MRLEVPTSLRLLEPRSVGGGSLYCGRRVAPFQGWEICFGLGYLGLCAARCTPGYHITGLQPLGESATN